MNARLIILFAALAPGCATLGGSSAGGGQVDRPAPDLVMRRFGGGESRLASLRGKVVLLNVWASWCEPCREEMPLLDDLAQRLRPEGVEVIAVSIDEDRAAAEAFARRRRRWSLTLAHDPSVADTMQPPTMPTSYVIDARGMVREVNSGFDRADVARLEVRLRKLASRR